MSAGKRSNRDGYLSPQLPLRQDDHEQPLPRVTMNSPSLPRTASATHSQFAEALPRENGMINVGGFRGLQRIDKVNATKHGPSVARIQFMLTTGLPECAMPEPVGDSQYGWPAARGR